MTGMFCMNQLHSKINIRSEDFKINQTAMQQLVDDLKQKAQHIALGGVRLSESFLA